MSDAWELKDVEPEYREEYAFLRGLAENAQVDLRQAISEMRDIERKCIAIRSAKR